MVPPNKILETIVALLAVIVLTPNCEPVNTEALIVGDIKTLVDGLNVNDESVYVT